MARAGGRRRRVGAHWKEGTTEGERLAPIFARACGRPRMAASATPQAQEILRLWTTVPTRALLKRHQRTAGVDKARASTVLTEYKRFVAIKILAGDHDDGEAGLAAPPAVHAIWKDHLLDTAAYAEHCRTLCGRTLHHAPDVAVDDAAKHALRCHRALLAYKKAFGGMPDDGSLWDYGELPPLSRDEERALADEAPAAKRAKASGAQQLAVSVQAPFLPLRTVSVRASISVGEFFQVFVEASGSTHLVAGRRATPPTTRLRCGNEWLHDLTPLGESGVKDGAVVYVAVPQERHSRDQIAVIVKDVAGGESATVFARASDAVQQLMRYAQDALGVPADAQQLVYRGSVLDPEDTLAARHVADGATVQMVVGRKRAQDAEMSPGGTWRVVKRR